MDCLSHLESGYMSLYTWLLHSFVFLSIPLYSLAIVALLRINSPYFVTYKHFLIWHTFTNLVAEIVNAWFLLPVVHLPHPLLRLTGIFAAWGMSGLMQFYILNGLIYQTALSILEMFLFRFKASQINYKYSLFYKYLLINIYIIRILMIIYLLLAITTYPYAIQKQAEYKIQIMTKFPDSPKEILCDGVVIAAPFSDFVSMSNMVIWLIVIIVTFTVTVSTTVYLNRYLRDQEQHSPTVIRMQKMLLVSLFVQTAIHGITLGTPNVMFVYAAFFGAHSKLSAIIAFICLTFHGFFSTIAMIIFTKPIRIAILKMFPCCKCGTLKIAHYHVGNKY